MPAANIDVDLGLLARARELTGGRSDSAVIELALRRLIAAKQKGALVAAIHELPDLPRELRAPVEHPIA